MKKIIGVLALLSILVFVIGCAEQTKIDATIDESAIEDVSDVSSEEAEIADGLADFDELDAMDSDLDDTSLDDLDDISLE